MRNLIHQLKIKFLVFLEMRLLGQLDKLNLKLKTLRIKIKAESARVQKRIK